MVVSYLRKDDSIFYVHKTKNIQTRLVEVKAAEPQSFIAVSYQVAKDQSFIYAHGKRVPGIKNVATFRALDQEVEIYFDGTTHYDRVLKPLPVHHATFTSIPLCDKNRAKLAEDYNQYLTQIGKAALPLQCSLMYSAFACDQQTLYQRNYTTGDLRPVAVESLQDIGDILAYAKTNLNLSTYSWFRELREH